MAHSIFQIGAHEDVTVATQSKPFRPFSFLIIVFVDVKLVFLIP